MADDPYYANLDPSAAPDPVTPSDSPPMRPPIPGDSWEGTAPYDIAGPQDIGGFSGACSAAEATAEARYAEGRQFFDSGAGLGAVSITTGFSPDSDTPNDIAPPGDYETPIQGYGDHPGTTQEGVQTYSGDAGAMEGLRPESGDMSGGGGGSYPGTGQAGLPMYGK